jgi:hypothetical protein
MARIRTIKPEFWDSPDTAGASFRTRLFYIAMWNWADDYGVGTANAKALIGFAFPNDEEITAKDFPTLRKEVADAFGVLFYEVDGRPFYAIPSWDRHQRTERKANRVNPPPPPEITAVGFSDATQGSTDDTQGSSGLGTGEQGNRGTVVKAPAARPPKPDPTQLRTAFDEFWNIYPRHTGKPSARKAWAKAIGRTDPETITAGAARYRDDPNRADAYTRYPATWLNDDGWADDPLPAQGPKTEPRAAAPMIQTWTPGGAP